MAHELCLNLFQYSTMFGAGAPVEVTLEAARDAGFQLVGLDVFSLDAAGLAPGAARALLDRHGVRCFEVLGLAVNASDDETMDAARRAARWVGETGAAWVLTVVDSPVDDALPLAGDLADEVMARQVWPGEGEFPLTEFRDAIRATGYAGPVSVEVLNAAWRADGVDVHDFARNAVRTSAPYWA